jgi:hypothetical protein
MGRTIYVVDADDARAALDQIKTDVPPEQLPNIAARH